MRNLNVVSAVLICALVASAQAARFSFGLIGGLPTSSGAPEGSHDESPLYSVGGTFEFALGDHLAAELNGLYRRVGNSAAIPVYRSDQPVVSGQTPTGTLEGYYVRRNRANSVEVPILGKYYFARRNSPGRFFVATGYSFLRSYLSATAGIERIDPAWSGSAYVTLPPGVPTETGAVFSAGWTRKAGPLTIAPSVRYTHWGARTDGASRNQLDILLGLRI
ncbi:MAG: outer membrane beta-barrel protein [Bryobacteraceae bacterium]|jgi:hypothetical protein